jgi:hypothetical protein
MNVCGTMRGLALGTRDPRELVLRGESGCQLHKRPVAINLVHPGGELPGVSGNLGCRHEIPFSAPLRVTAADENGDKVPR